MRGSFWGVRGGLRVVERLRAVCAQSCGRETVAERAAVVADRGVPATMLRGRGGRVDRADH